MLRYKPQHLSGYALTIEDNTAFGRWVSQGKMTPESDDFAAIQLEILVAMLASAGYRQYEVSNFSLPDFESRHNSSYWQAAKYLGIGPGAHSFDGDTRQHNVANNHHYLTSVHNQTIPAVVEKLTREDKINEYLLTTLRTSRGTNLNKLQQDLRIPPT